MSRVPLSKIRSLTLHKGEHTSARRVASVPQLQCVGKACKHYQPDVVRCVNNGGEGADIDWTCEADFPENLRFGRSQVSCEGWDRPGDPYVLKGSCGLEYDLIDISSRYGSASLIDNIMRLGFLAVSLYILYICLKPCMRGFNSWRNGPRDPPRPGSGGFYDRRRPHEYPPPPYSEQPSAKPAPGASNAFQPGFWGGLGLGALSGLAAARTFGGTAGTRTPYATTQEYDWERDRRASAAAYSTATRAGQATTSIRGQARNTDRGEGSSSSGSMRRSTAFGTTNVR